ncbi:PKD domain-containing protein [Streptomyces sp. NBC_00354]|uniref:PKD domain-containing protein n=1 Tax=Streptomyces sp. NBC_00354 TaxID=2975723 RepID=UPI002E25357A
MAAGVGLFPTTALAAPAAGNPDLAIALNARARSAHSIFLSYDISSVAAALDVTIAWGDGTTDKATAAGAGRHNTHHSYAEVGSHTVTVTVKDTAHDITAVKEIKAAPAGTEFTPHAPTRLLDTRSGLGAAKAKVGGRSSVALKVGGAAQIPADVVAVALNVTVTNATDAGHVAVQPGKEYIGSEASNLNYVAGQTVPNLVIVPVRDGHVQMFNGGWAPVDLIADVTGYFTASAASGYTSLDPVRAVDTREGLGTAKGQVPGYGSFEVDIAERHGVPMGVTAVALNLTVTNPQEAGHLTVYPNGQAAPSTSSVNFAAGQTVANSVIVPVGLDGKITIRNGSWSAADAVIDVVGYYSPDSRAAFQPLVEPYRVLDTREKSGYRERGPIAARDYLALPLQVYSPSPDPADGMVLNATVTNTKGAGFLSVAPDPNRWADYGLGVAVKPPRPVASALNWTAGTSVPNLVQTSGGKDELVDFWNQGWEDVDLVVDCLGFYESD